MSVEAFGDPESPPHGLGKISAEDCFWCGKPLVDPVVYWHGRCSGLALHPSCAEKLAVRLIYDARRATAIAEGKSLVAGIDRRWHDAARGAP